MNLKIGFVFAVAPFLLASSTSQKAIVERFLTATKMGTAYSSDDFSQIPTRDLAVFLASLKGCKKKRPERLTGGAYGVQWRCSDKPKKRAAVIYFDGGKIDRILPSTVRQKTISVPVRPSRSERK